MRRPSLKWLAPLSSLILLTLALMLLYRLTQTWHWHDVKSAIYQQSHSTLCYAIALTLLSYGCLCGYDLLALKALNKPLPTFQVCLTSFIAYTFSNTLGFALLTGTSVRYRVYASFGLTTSEIAKVVFFCTITFFLGLLGWGGIFLLIAPPNSLTFISSTLQSDASFIIAICSLGMIALYLFWPKPALTWRQYQLALPSYRIRALQWLVALLDWAMAASVLFVLIPDGHIAYFSLLKAFVFANLLGMLAHIPAGIGVFEAMMSWQLQDTIAPHQLLAALLLYRLIYYVLPFSLALLIFTRRQINPNNKASLWLNNFIKVIQIFVPALISFGTFAAGALLLCSAMMPTAIKRIEKISALLPLHFIEASHLLAATTGVALIILARSLYRRLDSAFRLTQACLIAAIIFSLLKGVEWELALFFGFFLLLIHPCRSLFYRKGSLIHGKWTPSWLLSIGVVILTALWLLFFSYRHIAYHDELWWLYSAHNGVSRALRAMGLALVLFSIMALINLLSPMKIKNNIHTIADSQQAYQLVQNEGGLHGYLALLNDKQLLFHPSGLAFLMYAIEGDSWIVMGDPIGRQNMIESLLWQFYELCDEHNAHPVFYQVTPRYLPFYLSLGLIPFKLGEEALVALADFDLASSRYRNLRQSHHRALREGLSFKVIASDEVEPHLTLLKEISDDWLKNKQGKEKAFSVGHFNAQYLTKNPMALVLYQDKIVGFANLWLSHNKECFSVDLMRYRHTNMPVPIMDFLFVELLCWGKSQHYSYFNLGMAPFSGFNDNPLASYWERLGNKVFEKGNRFYNFVGLRRYKEKFSPQWEMRYLLCQSRLVLPKTLSQLITLINRGPLGLFKREK